MNTKKMKKWVRDMKDQVSTYLGRGRGHLAALTGLAMATTAGQALAGGGGVASSIGGTAQTELTGAQTLIIGLLTTLVLIAIGFVVYNLIKKAR